MSRLRSLPLKSRLIVLVAVAVAGPMILGTSIFFYSRSSKSQDRTLNPVSLAGNIVSDPAKSMLQVGNLLSAISDDHANAEAHIAQLYQLRQQFEEDHATCIRALPESRLKDAISLEYDAGIRLFDAIEKEYLPLVRQKRLTKARQFHQARLEPMFAQHAEAADDVARLADELSKENQSLSSEHSPIEAQGWLSFGLAGVILLLGILTARRILSRVRKTLTLAKRFAAGDLTCRLHVDSNDEMGEIAHALNHAAAGLNETVAAIEDDSNFVADAAGDISAVAEGTSKDAETQDRCADKAAKSLQELSNSVGEVAAHYNSATDSALKAAEVARQGGDIVKEVLSTMHSVAESVRASAGKIDELGESSRQVGRVVEEIDKIADQTNLLALNAAIEAARAGEHGRGFAVIAEEVRKLSDRTTKATKEIAQMVENVQQNTSAVEKQVDTGNQQVESVLTTAAKAGETLEEIISAAREVVSTICRVQAVAGKQSGALKEFGSTIEEIAKLSRRMAAGARHSAGVSQDLSNIAYDLQTLSSGFHYGDAAVTAESFNEELPIASAFSSSPQANKSPVARPGIQEQEAEPVSLYESNTDAEPATAYEDIDIREPKTDDAISVVVPFESKPLEGETRAPEYDQAIA